MLRKLAEKALEGVGSMILGEWREFTGKAYHLRRRLTTVEQEFVGPMRDIRGKPEAIERLRKIGDTLCQPAKAMACEELGLLRYPT